MQLRIVHRYLGLVLSIIMLAISITGTLLLWKKEFLWFDIPVSREVIDASLMPQAIDNIENQYAAGEVIFIQLYSEDLSLHKVFLTDRRYAWHSQTGDHIEHWTSNGRFEDWLLDLHHRFLLGNKIGLQIAGIGGLLLLPLLVIGFIIWWPRRKTLRLGIVPKRISRGSFMVSHGNLGSVFFMAYFYTRINRCDFSLS